MKHLLFLRDLQPELKLIKKFAVRQVQNARQEIFYLRNLLKESIRIAVVQL